MLCSLAPALQTAFSCSFQVPSDLMSPLVHVQGSGSGSGSEEGSEADESEKDDESEADESEEEPPKKGSLAGKRAAPPPKGKAPPPKAPPVRTSRVWRPRIRDGVGCPRVDRGLVVILGGGGARMRARVRPRCGLADCGVGMCSPRRAARPQAREARARLLRMTRTRTRTRTRTTRTRAVCPPPLTHACRARMLHAMLLGAPPPLAPACAGSGGGRPRRTAAVLLSWALLLLSRSARG
jgi:hypothetical protein